MSNPTTASTTIFSFNSTSQSTLEPPASQANDSRSFFCLHRLMIALVFLIVWIIVVVSIAWLFLHPIRPVFRLTSLFISNFTLSNSRVFADYDIELTIYNPNKKVDLVIEHYHVSVVYNGVNIISKDWREHITLLKKMRQQSLSPSLPKDSVGYFVNEKMFNQIREEYRSSRVLNLNVEIKIRTRFCSTIWGTKESHMKVSCDDLNVEFLATKTPVIGKWKVEGGGKECAVDFVPV